MPEEDSPIPRLLALLVTKSYAVLASFAVTLGGATVLLLGERLDRSAILGAAGALAGILLATVWTAVAVASRLRAKISRLEGEVHSLRVRPSPALNEISACDRVLVAVHRNGGEYERFTEITELSQIRVDDCISRLRDDGLIEFHLAAPWENNSCYAITDLGRSYLLENHLVE